LNSYLFLFPHQDDEIGVFHELEYACQQDKNLSVTCVFITDGGIHGFRRQAESRHVLTKFGIAADNIQFVGANLGVIDSKAPDSIETIVNHLACVIQKTNPERVYFPAWEGGHQDHDSIHLATHVACDLTGFVGERLVYPLYTAANAGIGFFSFGRPPINCTAVFERKLTFRQGWRYFLLLLNYPSQWASLIPLSPMIFLMFVVRRRCFIGVSEMSVAPARPPHDGILLYERRGKYSWELFVEKIGPIFTRLNS
jgi:hypothetical protein